MYYLLIAILLYIEAIHDVFREKYVASVRNYSFIKDRQSKLIKLAGILLGCFIVYFLTHNLYYALFPIVLRMLVFDQLIALRRTGKLMNFKEWFKQTEVYYWYLIYKGEK